METQQQQQRQQQVFTPITASDSLVKVQVQADGSESSITRNNAFTFMQYSVFLCRLGRVKLLAVFW